MRIAGSRVLITGGASGLGRATAELALAGGASVVLLDQSPAVGDVAAELTGDADGHGTAGARAIGICGDVTSEADVLAAIAAARELGGLEVTVNCAGIGGGGRALRSDGPMPLDVFEHRIRVNLIGTFNVNRLSAAAMDEHGPLDGDRGVIINTASIAAFEGQIGQVSYASSKAGIVGMTLPLARELASRHIRVVTIAPGVFDTPLLGKLSEEVRQSLAAAVPYPRRIASPRAYAELALHIVENDMINGETIRLDGALRMAPR
jgi:NAD(P)-dependent dehydrogenase (short-subunit alcohol dehydrogenase family)